MAIFNLNGCFASDALNIQNDVYNIYFMTPIKCGLASVIDGNVEIVLMELPVSLVILARKHMTSEFNVLINKNFSSPINWLCNNNHVRISMLSCQW